MSFRKVGINDPVPAWVDHVEIFDPATAQQGHYYRIDPKNTGDHAQLVVACRMVFEDGRVATQKVFKREWNRVVFNLLKNEKDVPEEIQKLGAEAA